MSINNITIVAEPVTESDVPEKCCCNCEHNLRIKQKDYPKLIDYNECSIDGHYIGYIACFEDCCKNWTRTTAFD